METDHIALKWLRTVQHTNAGRLIRTAMEMQQYEMDIVHRAGIKMYDADALSRLRTTRGEHGPGDRDCVSCVTDQAIYYGEGDPTPPVSDYDEPTGPCSVMVKLLQ